MTEAWLVQRDAGDDWEIKFIEPDRWCYYAIKKIAFAELKEWKPDGSIEGQ